VTNLEDGITRSCFEQHQHLAVRHDTSMRMRSLSAGYVMRTEFHENSKRRFS